MTNATPIFEPIPASIADEIITLNHERLRRRLDEGRSLHMTGWKPSNYFDDHDRADDRPTGKRRLI